MVLTSVQQRNAVSEGAAFGLVVCGVDSLPLDESALNSAFTIAWRSWPYARAFPQVGTDIRNSKNGFLVLTRADLEKRTFNFYWDASGDELRIRPRPQWVYNDLDPAIIANDIDGNVSINGWRDLGAGLLQELGRAGAPLRQEGTAR